MRRASAVAAAGSLLIGALLFSGCEQPAVTPAEIEAKVKKDPALWAKHADGLRDAALESLKIIKARDAQGLFNAGDKIDKACESCHLEYWYPGDKKAVLEDQQKRVTYDKPKK
jgi:hypothetical protein